MQKIDRNTVLLSDLPKSLVESLEKLLLGQIVKKKLTIGQIDYVFLGFLSNDTFVSFPLLDMCVVQDAEVNCKYDKSDTYQIKLSSFFGPDSEGVETEKSFFLINVNRDYLSYLSSLKSKYRSQMNNIKSPFRYSIASNFKMRDVDLFYKIYINRMREIGTLPMPKDFFYGLSDSESIFLSRVVVDGNYRAASISVKVKDVMHLIWAASDNRQSANLFMYRELIRFCCNDKEIKFLNIGRATNKSSQYKFKERIGGDRIPIREFSNRGLLNRRSKLPRYAQKLYRLVPLFFIEMLSRAIYRRFIR